MKATTLELLRSELGPIVRTDDDLLDARRHDYWAVSHLRDWRGQGPSRPGCVVQPTSSADVQRTIRLANRERIAVMPYGLGSGVCGGILPDDDVLLLDLSSLDRTRAIDEVDLLASFDAGKNGLLAEQEVAALGLTIGHWPQSIALSSVGGWISTRASGQFSTAYGNIEDIVYSIEAVMPNGDLVQLGKAPRAAAGPDLRHVLMGAEGTLGVVTGVTFSLRRAPEARRFSAFYADSMRAGIEAQRRIVHADWRPPVMRQYDHPEVKRNFREHVDGESALLLMVHEGPTGRVTAELDDVARIAIEAGLRHANPVVCEEWMERRNHVPTWRDFFEMGIVVDTIEISAPWSRIDDLYDDAIASLRAIDGVVNASAHSSHAYRSGVNLYFSFAARRDPDQLESAYFDCWRAVMEATVRNGGGVAHHHGAGRLRKPWIASDLGDVGISLLRTLKSAVDPNGIMNPGNLIPD
jgi:alkyldihydroxyacetonephosphate synthase